MTTYTDLAAQALNACKATCERIINQDGGILGGVDFHALLKSVNAALSTERLAESGEPVAFVDERAISWLASRINSKTAHITTKLSKEKSFERPLALYTTPPPQAERLPLSDEQEDAARWRYLIKADCPTVCVMDDKTGEWLPIHPKNIQAVVDAERGIGSPKEST